MKHERFNNLTELNSKDLTRLNINDEDRNIIKLSISKEQTRANIIYLFYADKNKLNEIGLSLNGFRILIDDVFDEYCRDKRDEADANNEPYLIDYHLQNLKQCLRDDLYCDFPITKMSIDLTSFEKDRTLSQIKEYLFILNGKINQRKEVNKPFSVEINDNLLSKENRENLERGVLLLNKRATIKGDMD